MADGRGSSARARCPAREPASSPKSPGISSFRRHLRSEVADRLAVAAQALAGVVVTGRPLDERDAPVPQADQMPRHGIGAAAVVHVDGVERQVERRAVEQHGGQRLGQVGAQGLQGAWRWGHEDQPVDAPAQSPQHGRDLLAVVVRPGDQDVIPPPPCRGVDAADQLGEELAVDVRQEDAQRVGLVGREAAGRAVRDVAEALHHLPDAEPGLLADRPLVVENAGHRGHRDTSQPRHLFDGGVRGRRVCRSVLARHGAM